MVRDSLLIILILMINELVFQQLSVERNYITNTFKIYHLSKSFHQTITLTNKDSNFKIHIKQNLTLELLYIHIILLSI
ncbi:hypothetical protein V1478_002916 [Vespula squamosa]|uniref:Uncharacterized protein n=1 Tax=Vespula squamosa TaxID=30214 RepID=A0ABD2BR85_VESSQ